MAGELKREIGLFGAVAYGVGTIVGAGIYALIGVAAGRAGNEVWLAFAIAGAIAAFTGLSYARLSALFPVSGAEYVYVEEAFKSRFGAFIVGWLVMLSGLISASAVALGFGGYLSALVPVPRELAAAALIAALSLVNYRGIKESIALTVVMTLIELAGIVIMIVLGANFFGSVDYLESPTGFSGIIGAVGIIFFAFIGFEGLVKIGEETKDPTKTIPRALILSLTISTVLYILAAISVVSIMPYGELATSPSPLADVAMRAQGAESAALLTGIALFSTTNTVLIILIATSRIAYGMSVESVLPKALATLHPERGTPRLAIFLTMVGAIIFCFIGDIEFTANIANFTIFLVFLAVNLAVLQFIRKGFKMKRSAAPAALAGAVTSLLLLTQFDWLVVAVSAIVIAVGALVYRFVAFDLR